MTIKVVLLTSCIMFPGLAAAQEADRVSYTMGVATGYVIESQAFEVPGPVINGGVSYQLNDNVSFDVWAQYGEDDLSREIDLTATWSNTIGPVDISVTAGGYLYPSGGSDTIYMLATEASVPMGPIALELSAERNDGGFENTSLSVAFSGTVADTVDVTLGKAFNTGNINPWFVRVSVPIGREDLGLRAGVRAFTGAGSGMIFEFTRRR